jgi:phosphoglycerate-specific signal transduction histidine kinase
LNIGGRLALAFATMVALTLVVGLYGLTRMRVLNDTAARITEERFAKVRLAQQGVQKMNENSRVALQLFLVGDSVEFDRQLTRQAVTSGEITKILDVFEQSVVADDERILAPFSVSRALHAASSKAS